MGNLIFSFINNLKGHSSKIKLVIVVSIPCFFNIEINFKSVF